MIVPDTNTPLAPRRIGPPKEFLQRATPLLKRLGIAVKERMIAASEEMGLSPYDHGVLSLLEEQELETQGMIADALGHDRSHLVGVLDDLERRGLIERRRDPSDRRRHLVTLTPEGRRTLTQLRASARRIDDEFMAPLDPEERETLIRLLGRLLSYHDPRCALPEPERQTKP
jgi:DNA-binding MarR family transcriptional regulator